MRQIGDNSQITDGVPQSRPCLLVHETPKICLILSDCVRASHDSGSGTVVDDGFLNVLDLSRLRKRLSFCQRRAPLKLVPDRKQPEHRW